MRIDRRRFLGALALAPAALAGCAGSGAASSGAIGPLARGRPPGAASSPVTASSSGAAEAVRAFPLGPDVEPAILFRAAAARPGER